MSRLRSWLLVTLCASALALAGCGTAVSALTTAAPATTTAPAVVSSGASTGSEITYIPAQDRSPAGSAGTAPTVVVPPGKPPINLETADLIVGKGPAAKDGDKVTVQYVLATYSTRKVIQSSWTSQPFGFTLGAGQVIPGWDEGVVGMKAGGRRELIIPPSLGYGDESPGAGIATNDTLVFVIDLLKIG
ncbi:MAG: FKBP-type peptidyl-prolyl cis-trans isomerase [Acidimicrobiales bacterium]